MLAPLVTFLIVGVSYACLLCPSVYWLDSGELAAASYELGIAHAPGQPLALLVGKLFAFLPLGDVSLRVGLGQLYCGAGAAAIVTWLGARIAGRFVEGPHERGALGIAAGLLYASSYAAAFQAIRPEVYALSALLVLAAFALCLRYAEEHDARLLGVAGLLFGLGLANHHYLVLLGAVPPAIALLWPRDREARARLAHGASLGAVGTLLGLLVYAYLPLRSAHDPIIDWGHPRSLASFFWTVSARSFQKSAGIGGSDDLPSLAGALLDQLGPAVVLLALGGLYLGVRRAPRLGLALALLLLGPIGARLLVSFDAGNPDAFGYLSTGIAALSLSALPFVAGVIAALPTSLRGGAALACVALTVLRGAVAAPSLSLAGFEDTREIFSPVVARIPTGALVVPSYFQTTFTLDYLRVVEGLRPDLSLLPRHFLSHPGEPEAIARREPALAPLILDHHLDLPALQALSRPLVYEYDLDLDRSLLPHAMTIPIGDASLDELQTRRFAIWQAYLEAHRLCRTGADAVEAARAMQILRARARLDAGTASSAFIDGLAAQCASLR